MRILVLGGTVFLGRHVVQQALERGHEVTIYSRGQHGQPPEDAEHVIGDRADVTPLRGRDWDATIDTSGYTPEQLEQSDDARRRPLRLRLDLQRLSRLARAPVDEDSPTFQDRATGTANTRPPRSGSDSNEATSRRSGPASSSARTTTCSGCRGGCGGSCEGGKVPAPGDPDQRAAADRRARSRRLPAAPRRDAHRRRLQRHRTDRSDHLPGGTRAPPVTQNSSGSQTRSSKRRTSSHGSSCRCGFPKRFEGTFQIGTAKAQAGRAQRPGRSSRPSSDVRTLARRRRRARTRRLALRAPRRPHEQGARGGTIPTPVLGIRAP